MLVFGNKNNKKQNYSCVIDFFFFIIIISWVPGTWVYLISSKLIIYDKIFNNNDIHNIMMKYEIMVFFFVLY